jgi:predicted enzyme related to lactoylglutathione lyase
MAVFCESVLGFERTLERRDFVVFDAPNGDRLELFGPAGPQPGYQFAANPVVVGFAVPDLEAARRRLVAAGVELLGEPAQGQTWQHFRAPDGRVYEVTC